MAGINPIGSSMYPNDLPLINTPAIDTHHTTVFETQEQLITMMYAHQVNEWRQYYFDYKRAIDYVERLKQIKLGASNNFNQNSMEEFEVERDIQSDDNAYSILNDTEWNEAKFNAGKSKCSINLADSNIEDEFKLFMKFELERVHKFHHELYSELQSDYYELERHSKYDHEDGNRKFNKIRLVDNSYMTKTSFFTLYRHQTLLYQFSKVNKAAFEDIFSRFDTTVGSVVPDHDYIYIKELFAHKFDASDKNCSINGNYEMDFSNLFIFNIARQTEFIDLTINLYASIFESGDTEKAKILLLSRFSDYSVNVKKSDILGLGVKIGVLIGFCLWILYSIVKLRVNYIGVFETTVSMLAASPVYRGIGVLLLMCWFYGVAVWIWSRYRINFVFIFQFNPRNYLTHFEIFDELAGVSLVYLISLLLYLNHLDVTSPVRLKFVPIITYPFALFVFMAIKIFTPSQYVSKWSTRRYLLITLYNVFISPFGRQTFVDIFVCNLLTSLIKVSIDMERFVCFLVTGGWYNTGIGQFDGNVYPQCINFDTYVAPLVSLIPFWIRFVQCIRRYYDFSNRRHLINAGKYALSGSLIIMSALHPNYSVSGTDLNNQWGASRIIWIILGVLAVLYTSSWDAFVNWAVFRKKKPFPHYVYVVVVIVNIFLRLSWTITILPTFVNPYYIIDKSGVDQFYYNVVFLPLIMIAEVFRRMMWAVLRVELEHSTLEHTFKKSDYISACFPIQEPDQVKIKRNSSDIIFQVVIALLFIAICAALISLTYV